MEIPHKEPTLNFAGDNSQSATGCQGGKIGCSYNAIHYLRPAAKLIAPLIVKTYALRGPVNSEKGL